jgi:hypothetical protein
MSNKNMLAIMAIAVALAAFATPSTRTYLTDSLPNDGAQITFNWKPGDTLRVRDEVTLEATLHIPPLAEEEILWWESNNPASVDVMPKDSITVNNPIWGNGFRRAGTMRGIYYGSAQVCVEIRQREAEDLPGLVKECRLVHVGNRPAPGAEMLSPIW